MYGPCLEGPLRRPNGSPGILCMSQTTQTDSRNRGWLVQVSWHAGITKKQEKYRIGRMWLEEMDASAPIFGLPVAWKDRREAKGVCFPSIYLWSGHGHSAS